ncbi:putative membrane protein [Clostridium sp. CAG:417]|nr:putative membrane protein [Clostridium sp. CAG:417]
MKSKSKLILNILTIIGIVAVIFFIYFAVKERWFLDNEILLTKIKSFGLLAPLCFILIQIVQVVLPVIPGGASCLVGVMAFGAVGGFIYNYVGLVLGSICSFLLSRKFGMSIINKLFKEKDIKKALDKINNSKYDLIFFLIILLPGLPDDLFCYISGITKMSLKKFTLIILICKPLTLLVYSICFQFFPIIFGKFL